MIKVIVKKDNYINKVVIEGHAAYADFGKDIVCAATSSIIITTINAILSIDDKAIKYQLDKKFIIEILYDNEIISKLMDNMLNMLQELSDNYPKNINIKEE
ncbi:MAG TPA: ribosomal-processing cysteine protease Prp [Bacilli bacterium]|nr:ribosomal-processing cysteine protease Prp [Bacilli bacterium]